MKNRMLFGILLFFVINAYSQEYGFLKDDRDQKEYLTIKLGKQVWMAENLAYNYSSSTFLNDETWDSSTTKYGRFYPVEITDDVNLCPVNRHIPTDGEWKIMLNTIKAYKDNQKVLTEFLKGGEIGFNVELIGNKQFSGWIDFGMTATFATSSTEKRTYNTVQNIAYEFWSKEYAGYYLFNRNFIVDAYVNVRCLKDN